MSFTLEWMNKNCVIFHARLSYKKKPQKSIFFNSPICKYLLEIFPLYKHTFTNNQLFCCSNVTLWATLLQNVNHGVQAKFL